MERNVGDAVYVIARIYGGPTENKIVYQLLHIPIQEILPYNGYWFDVADYVYYRIFRHNQLYSTIEDTINVMQNNWEF